MKSLRDELRLRDRRRRAKVFVDDVLGAKNALERLRRIVVKSFAEPVIAENALFFRLELNFRLIEKPFDFAR